MGAQQRVAQIITDFSGSMPFLYLHAAIFAVWCGSGLFGFDPFPFNFLTMTVSLEAIFLLTFVMIGQNRQAALAAAKAAHDYQVSQQLLEDNTRLTTEIHKVTVKP